MTTERYAKMGELEGVTQETLERIDHVSRPSKDGPIPRFPQDVIRYERPVLLALTENTLARQQADATQSWKAS